MDDVCIEIVLDNNGVVRPRRCDTNEKGPEFRMQAAGIDREIIRLFEGWLCQRNRDWYDVEIRLFGSLLHRFLFGEHGCWDWVEAQIQQVEESARPHVELVFPADGDYARLAAIPWEYLYRPDQPTRQGEYLAAGPKVVLSRYIPREQGRTRVPEYDQLHVLLVVSRPNDQGPVQYENVVARVKQTAQTLNWSVAELHDPTRDRLYETLRTESPDLVHYIGHGRFDVKSGEGTLALVDSSGDSDLTPDRVLAEIMTRDGSPPRAVVLHACEGGRVDFPISFAGVAAQLARNGVAYVVAMQYAVTNEAATEFSRCLYETMADGADFGFAVQNARWHVSRLGGQPDPKLLGMPVVYRQAAGPLLRPGAGR